MAGLVAFFRRREKELHLALESELAARKEMQQKLALDHNQRQAQEEALFDSMVEGVLVLDANGKIQLANSTLEKMMAISGDVRGKTILEAFR
jgi:sensor histidine kinase regulating citrate/malate metabolism